MLGRVKAAEGLGPAVPADTMDKKMDHSFEIGQ